MSLHINFGLLEEDCCRVSFLRGVFLAGGSVTDPAKRYHMEFVTSHYKVSRELEALLIDMGFSATAIADRVGHESIDITYNYAHLFPSKQTEMAETLNMERSN